MGGALEGLRVLDLSRYIAGPYCAMLLADFGADVVKVERPEGGDDARHNHPQIDGESLYYMALNRNKRGITLNFRHKDAQVLLRKLVAEADVLIENFRPGTMEKMGCGWDELRAINPRLIMARISGFGQDGPLVNEPCFDPIAQAMSGLMDMTGQPDGKPTMIGTYIVDYSAAFMSTIGVLTALQHRTRTGLGQVVDASLLDSALSILTSAIPEQLLFNRGTTRIGNRDRNAAPGNSFQARDGVWVHFNAGNAAHFPRLANAMGRADLLSNPDFAASKTRLDNVDAIEAIVAAWVATVSSDDLLGLLKAAEVPAAKIATMAEVVEHPQVRHRDMIIDVQHPVAGRVPMAGIPFKLSESPGSIRLPAPTLGQHNDEVLRDWLNCTHDDIAALRAANAI